MVWQNGTLHGAYARFAGKVPVLNDIKDINNTVCFFEIMNRLRAVLILCISLLLFQAATAQNVYYSPYEKFDFRGGDFAVVGKVNGRLYTYRASSEGFYLDAYNDVMERQATIVLDFFPSKIYQTKFVAYADKIIILYQAIRENRIIQYAALLDAMGRLVKDPITLNSAKVGYFGPNREYFSSAVSDDKKRIFIYGVNKKGANINVKGAFINDGLEIERETEADFTADNSVEYGEGILANAGTFYLPVYTPLGSKDFADQLFLLALQQGSNSFVKHEVPLNQKYAAGTFMKMDNPNNRIYIGGFYSEKKSGNYEGVLYTYFDVASSSFQNRKNIAFDEKLRNGTGERNTKKALNDYQVRQIIVKNDGGFVMVAENYYVTTRNSYAPGFGYYSMYYSSMTPNVREYHYEDILALSYNAEGVREWHSFVRKNQYSQEDGGVFSSYGMLNTGGTIGFLFNDFNTSRSRIQLASLDGDGKLNIRSLAAEGNEEPDWLPRSGKQVSSREMVVPALRKRQICFAKIVF
jgi:hypothetical protein